MLSNIEILITLPTCNESVVRIGIHNVIHTIHLKINEKNNHTNKTTHQLKLTRQCACVSKASPYLSYEYLSLLPTLSLSIRERNQREKPVSQKAIFRSGLSCRSPATSFHPFHPYKVLSWCAVEERTENECPACFACMIPQQ